MTRPPIRPRIHGRKRLVALVFILTALVGHATAGELPNLPADPFAFARPAATDRGPRLPDDVFAWPEDEGAVDVVLFSHARAAVVRIQVQIGGTPYRRVWIDFLRELHAYLDRDSDGKVSTTEATSVPWTTIVANPFLGGNNARGMARPRSLDSAPADGVVTVEELDAFLRDTQRLSALTIQPGGALDPRTEAFWAQLDADRNGRIAPAESDAMLVRLDQDEDEFVSLDELTPDRVPASNANFIARPDVQVPPNPANDAAVVLDSPETRALVVRRLLDTFGPRPLKSRERASIPSTALLVDPVQTHLADSDHDGRLDRAELDALLTYPRAVLAISASLPAGGSPAVGVNGRLAGAISIPSGPVSRPAQGLNVSAEADGTPLIKLDEVEFVAVASEANQNIESFLRQQFVQADTNKDGIVDSKESRGNRFVQQIFLLADRDRNGSLTREENDRYLDLSRNSGQARTVASVSPRGDGLFARVDTNNDNRLTLRELRAAGTSLARLDRNGDGRLMPDEMPRRFELNVGRGQAVNRQVFAVATSVPAPGRPLASTSDLVPTWFQAMDRNGDGDVSQREFLGPALVFRSLDSDGDGLIDSKEAQSPR